jgi:diguanylate cyclase (GGDEF)-like protein
VSVTAIASIGQGIHDIGIMAFPIIVVIASLILKRSDFHFTSCLTILALGWLVFGDMEGLFTARKIDPPTSIDFLVVSTILGVGILAADLLAENFRYSLQSTQDELRHRKALEERLRYQSIHDILTGVFNRAFFEEEIERMDRNREFPVSIIVGDINDLKEVNDTQGHAVGDELLRRAAFVFGTAFRGSDILARIGGDEFAVLLSHTDALTASHMMDRVRLKIMEHNQKYPDLPIRIALGVATAEQGKLAEAFVIADQRMYADKAASKKIMEEKKIQR